MPIIEFNGKGYEVDEDGYLMNFEKWDKDFAIESAAKDGIDLRDGAPQSVERWEAIDFAREFYKIYRIAFTLKIFGRDFGKKFGPEKGSAKYLYDLFPLGPTKQIYKYAGIFYEYR